jgi:hypothetical protein
MDRQGRTRGEVDVEGDGWTAVIRYALDPPNLRFTRITLDSADDIPSTLLRRIPLGEVRAYLRQTFVEHSYLMSFSALLDHHGARPSSDQERVFIKEQARRAQRASDVLKASKPRRGPGANNDEHWASIAELYLYCVRVYGQKAIEGMLAELENREELFWSRSTVKTYARRARELGWLTKGTQGKAGAEPGPKLTKWRKEHK